MDIPPPGELLDRVGSLPAGRPLVQRLGQHANVHLVGGAVRDLLLGESPTDLDLVVEGDGQPLVADLGGRGVRHERFGTWTVALEGHSYDIAQARREIYPRPGALPEVSPGTLAEDLTRRDFTVNALAVALGGPQAGTLTAVPHALEDLERGRLRVLHDRSFQDDPTRLLRLARYASRLGFQAEDHTAELATAALAHRALNSVSGARIGAELRLMAAEPDPLAALELLSDLDLAEAIHPQFGLPAGETGLARRALSLFPADTPRERLVLALAARRVPAAELRELLDRLAFEASDREVIVAAAARGEELARALAAARRPSEVSEIAAGAPPEVVALAGALGPEEAARSWLEHLRHVRLEIAGADLLDAGVEQGPAVGRGLRAALAAKLDGRVQSRQGELDVALEASRSAG